MCGRFSNRLTWSELHEVLSLLGAFYRGMQ